MLSQALYDIPQLLHLLGLTDVIISPGSRSAPLTIAFSRHSGFKKYVIPDERSAAFVALGISLQSQKPTVLVCTSGSAAYNYAPAVAEAYYQQVPLLVLTADRPPEWIDQWDGQTIRQQNIYGQHVLKSFQLPSTDLSDVAQWHMLRIVNEATVLSMGDTPGPVHINVPLREPLYTSENYQYTEKLKFWTQDTVRASPSKNLVGSIKYRRVLLLVGQQNYVPGIDELLAKLASLIPVVCDAQSNYSHLENVITHHDLFLSGQLSEELRPELVISFGKSIISKNLKVFLRNVLGLEHWHITETDFTPDTFQSLTKVIRGRADSLLDLLTDQDYNTSYLTSWRNLQVKTGNYLQQAFDKQDFGEFEAVKILLDHLPEKVDIHISNSMPIRYVNFLGVHHADQHIFVNRGTSGIDGTVSTAVGSCLYSGNKTVLVTGDLAFFYDRNGLWHNHPPKDLLIILLNNHGGGIFGMIPGPRSQPEIHDYFITDQKLSAEHTTKDFNMEYIRINTREALHQELPSMMAKKGLRLIEIETQTSVNQEVFDKIKSEIKAL